MLVLAKKGIMFALVTILCVPAGLIDFLGIVAGHVYLRDELNRIAERESYVAFNLLRPRLNRRLFACDIFKCIFLNGNELILPRISLKFVPKVRINNIPASLYNFQPILKKS